MAKKNKWTIQVDGVEHTVEYKKGFKCKMVVDGNETILKSKNPFVIIIDEPIQLESKEVNLVVTGMKADLAVDGFFLGSQKKYVPIDDLPKWTWLFVGACMLPLIVFIGGVFNVIFGIFGSLLCLSNVMAENRSKTLKIILNVIIVICVWLADVKMMHMVASALR